jgi:hypothetical protein
MNNIQASLVELKINIERAASTDRPVVREIYLRKSLELIDSCLKSANHSTGNRGGVGKAERSQQSARQLFPTAS